MLDPTNDTEAASNTSATEGSSSHAIGKDCTKREVCPPVSARKDDTGKPDLSLIPYGSACEIARGFMYGERRYGRNNFRTGLAYSRTVAAAQRHLGRFFDGESIDPDSGVHHLALAAASCIMALQNCLDGTGIDDRWQQDTRRADGIGQDATGITSQEPVREVQVQPEPWHGQAGGGARTSDDAGRGIRYTGDLPPVWIGGKYVTP